MTRCGRLGAAVSAALVGTVVVAPPASAHTIGGVASTNYRSQITSLAPPVPGLTVRLRDLGRRVELVNRTPTEVVVLGYAGEPYLRVGPRGVFENRRSPAVYQNRLPRPGATSTTLPAVADPSAPPRWHRVGGGPTVRWRDQRTRWEGSDPPAVHRQPHAAHVVVPLWTLELRRQGVPVLVSGRITWVPPPPVLPWLLATAGLLAATAAMSRAGHWGLWLSGATAVLVAVDMVHAFAAAAVSGDPLAVQAVKVLLGGIFLTAAWVTGALAIGPLQEQREGGVVAAVATGLLIALGSGASDASTLIRSQVPSVLPPGLVRLAVAVSLGVGLGLVTAGLLVLWRPRRGHPAPA